MCALGAQTSFWWGLSLPRGGVVGVVVNLRCASSVLCAGLLSGCSCFGDVDCIPPRGEFPFDWDVSSLLRPPAAPFPRHLLTGQDPWLERARVHAASLGRTPILVPTNWTDDDAVLKDFSPLYGAQKRLMYTWTDALDVRPPFSFPGAHQQGVGVSDGAAHVAFDVHNTQVGWRGTPGGCLL